jgi:broad specificity phosphatase PhoE
LARLHFLTHPEVVIDPAVPVPEWRLSEKGLARMRLAAARPWLAPVRSVFSSTERKARDGAVILADRLGVEPVRVAELGENDRSATGYLPMAEFESVADAFFARPEDSVRGWERAVDAQARIVAAVGSILARAPPGDIVVVSHGGVGALLLASLMAVAISRAWDQPGGGGGNRFVFDMETHAVLHGWQPIEA